MEEIIKMQMEVDTKQNKAFFNVTVDSASILIKDDFQGTSIIRKSRSCSYF